MVAYMTPNTTFELKARSHKVLSLRILKGDTTTILSRLRAHLGEPNGLFRDSLLVIDLSNLEDPHTAINFPAVCGLLKEYGLIPFGLHGGNSKHVLDATEMGLQPVPASLVSATQGVAPAAAEPVTETQTIAATPAAGGNEDNKTISKTVHSGQRIVAAGDLTILASVNSGAEVIAGGSIHIYGALRGRALAGGSDNTEASIFCLDLEPELIAVAGEYLVYDEIDGNLFGKTTTITLQDGKLNIVKLGILSPDEKQSPE
ncbi:MAG: septum site-determining protein MinC [Desulfuromonadaceae bacterium]|nr:septum site-determining protein MinC [Desulfuromonas sp.]MDY0185502.1 septum site-determining protein MinC [Desulfuromonadaceae bacterium]